MTREEWSRKHDEWEKDLWSFWLNEGIGGLEIKSWNEWSKS